MSVKPTLSVNRQILTKLVTANNLITFPNVDHIIPSIH